MKISLMRTSKQPSSRTADRPIEKPLLVRRRADSSSNMSQSYLQRWLRREPICFAVTPLLHPRLLPRGQKFIPRAPRGELRGVRDVDADQHAEAAILFHA